MGVTPRHTPSVEIPATGFAFPATLGSASLPVIEKWDANSDLNGACSYQWQEGIAGAPSTITRSPRRGRASVAGGVLVGLDEDVGGGGDVSGCVVVAE